MSKQKQNAGSRNKRGASDTMATMRMEDLQLGQSGNPENQVDLIDDVSDLLDLDAKPVCDSPGTPLDRVAAISKQIQQLTQSLQQNHNSSSDHETVVRMIEMEAQLAKLQNEFKKQNNHGDKLESGLQLLDAFGSKLESLTEHVQLMAIDHEPKDYTNHFSDLSGSINELAGEFKSVGVLLNERPDNSSDFHKQLEAIGEVGLKIDDLLAQTGNKEHLEQLNKKLDSINEMVQSNETLNGLTEEIESILPAIQKMESLENLAEKMDGLVATVGNTEKLEALESRLESMAKTVQKVELLDDLAIKLESISSTADQSDRFDSINSRLDTLAEKSNAHEGIEEVGKQLESLSDFVKLGALENENLDTAKIQGMADQITAIGQMLVERNENPGSAAQDHPLLEQLNTNVESLSELVLQKNEPGESEGMVSALSENVAQMIEKFDALRNTVDENLLADVGGADSSERINALTEKLDNLTSLLENRGDAPASLDGDAAVHSEHIQSLTQKIDQTRETVSALVNSLVPLVDSMRSQTTGDSAAVENDQLSGWEQQKKALLEGYGIETSDEVASEIEDATRSGGDDEPKSGSGKSNDEVSTPELDELRNQLEEKLRQAEIDISIERAKIHQERRDLEELQSDLDCKQAKIDTHSSKTASSDDDNEEPGQPSGGRWSRFLGN